MDLARAVGAAIVAADLTQIAVATATGIDQGRISKMIRGADNRRPTLDELRKIEAACGHPFGYILGFAGLISPEGALRGAKAAAAADRAKRTK